MSKGTEYLRQIARRHGGSKGIPSLCSSNEYVIKAALEYAKDNEQFVLIEATANQVNQYGGYTGMTPLDFKNYVFSLADNIGLDKEKVILGGDHLGPVVFQQQNELDAMAEAETLITEFVMAGFEKIHIDTSMRLADDPIDQPLCDAVIAQRSARLCKAAEETYRQVFGKPSEMVYVVGSEVPIPGGAQSDHEAQIQVTKPVDFEATVNTFRQAFNEAGIADVFSRVIAVVVQPGVEFGDDSVDEYDAQKAKVLVDKLKEYDGIVFEGHSTDYQTPRALKEMARDGIRILKVGPELTFALREGLFALSFIEKEMELKNPSGFVEALDGVMSDNPEHWQKHYSGNDQAIKIKRKYSYSDRSRYYYGEKQITSAIDRLIKNINHCKIPITLISQFLPCQYDCIRNSLIECDAASVIKSKIKEVLCKYYNAVREDALGE